MAGIRALVLVPTAELCRQIKDVFVALSKYCQSEISVGFLTRDTPENVRRYVQSLSQVREREREREREIEGERERESIYARF
jgi:superfamily II DNA/RNA helicase